MDGDSGINTKWLWLGSIGALFLSWDCFSAWGELIDGTSELAAEGMGGVQLAKCLLLTALSLLFWVSAATEFRSRRN